MSMTPVTPDFNSSLRSFWDKKEGKYGKGVLTLGAIGVVIAIIMFYASISAFVTAMLVDLLHQILLVGVIGFLTSPIWSKRVRFLLQSAFEMVMRAGLGFVIELDPIGILRENIVKLKEKGQVFDKAVDGIAGSRQRLTEEIGKNKTAIQKNFNLVASTDNELAKLNTQLQAAQDNRRRQEIGLAINRMSLQKENYKATAGLCMESIKTEQPLLDRADMMFDQLSRLKDLAEFKVQFLSNQADLLEQRRNMIISAQKGLSAANSILKGDPRQLELVDQTINFLDTEASNTIGALDNFNRWSEKYLTDMDIQQGARSAEADTMFKQMEQQLSLPKSSTIDMPVINTQLDRQGVYSPVGSSTDDYSKLLS